METCRATPLFSPPQAFDGRNKGTSQKQTSSLLKLTSRVPKEKGEMERMGEKRRRQTKRKGQGMKEREIASTVIFKSERR